MILKRNTINIGEKPLFERSRLRAPFESQYQMEDMACFFYIIEGKYEIVERHGPLTATRQEGLLKKCGNYVTHIRESATHPECEAVIIYLYREVLLEIYQQQAPNFTIEADNLTQPKKYIANELIEKYMQNLSLYFDNPSLIDEDLAMLKLKELILILLRSDQAQNVQRFLIDLFSPGNLTFTTIIENNIFSNVTLEELAFICNKSLSTFKREFKKVYNQTPARYIKQRRLEHAAKLLLTSDELISGIAYDSGFQDPSTFSDVFQQTYGLSPSQYRLNQMRKKLD